MKKLPALFLYVIACVTVTSCMQNDHNINISYSEDALYYSMNAHFPKNRTREVDDYMDSRIGEKSNISFTNARTDATFTLNDHTTFYMKKYPGFIEIKLDKDKNSDEAYRQVKSMCEGIKILLVK